MVLALKVRLQDAEKARLFLQKQGYYNHEFLVKKEWDYIYFPVTHFDVKKAKLNGKVVDVELPRRQEKTDPFNKILTKRERELLPTSFEVVGDILIVELPEELRKKEKQIAEMFLRLYKHVKTVVKKSDIHSGVFRTRKVMVLAGENRKETLYRESGCWFHVDLEKMYFSSRLSGERLRIAKQVKKNEDVLVMFSGAAPYPVIIAKHSPAKSVVGIEINPDAHAFGLENIKKNRLENKIKLFLGDVQKVLPRLKRRFDRIVMPLPKTGEEFLPLVLKHVKRGGIVHYYAFFGLEQVDDSKKKIKGICKQAGKRCRILRWRKVGQHAPYVWRVCYDIKVL